MREIRAANRHDKRDAVSFHMVNFSLMSTNVPLGLFIVSMHLKSFDLFFVAVNMTTFVTPHDPAVKSFVTDTKINHLSNICM